MKTLTKALAKGTIATVAAGAMVMGSATPALARNGDDGIDAGDIIAGALIIGGIAAVAAIASDNDRGYDNRTYDNGYRGEYRGYDNGNYDNRNYNRAGNPRQAVEQCVQAAERNAGRYSYRGNAQVTDIRDIDRRRDGYTVKGRIAVNAQGRNWRRGDARYGNGWNGDYRGWNSAYRGYDAGSFTCRVRHGQVVDVDYSGIRRG